jgi:hypothetical protein
VAYKLDPPESSLVHLMFHVSQLKQAVGSKFHVTPVVPDGMLHMEVPEQSALASSGGAREEICDAGAGEMVILAGVARHLGRP